MEIPELKRLVTVDREHLVHVRNKSSNLGYESTFDEYATELLTEKLFVSESDKKLLDHGGKLQVAYWIESYSNE